MHLVQAALTAHSVGGDIMDPWPGIKWSGRSRRIKRIQSIVHRFYSGRLFSQLMKIGPELSVLVGCTQSIKIAGCLGGLLRHGYSALSHCWRHISTTVLHADLVAYTPVEGAWIDHSGCGRGVSGVHGCWLVLDTHLGRIIWALRRVLELAMAFEAAHLDGPSPWIIREIVLLDRLTEACFTQVRWLCQRCHRLRWLQSEGMLLKG